jgi:hypothetical protein
VHINGYNVHINLPHSLKEFCKGNKQLKKGNAMYGRGAGPVSLGAGVAVLPNTGGSRLLMTVSIVSIVTGSVIVLTTLARFAAKLTYKA